MGKTYTWEWGDWHDAIEWHAKHGGQLFPQRTIESAITISSGNKCHTFWPKNSALRSQVIALGESLGYPSDLLENITGGRLAKWYVKEILSIPYQGSYWGKRYRELAKAGFHWHYLYCKPGSYDVAMEIDLKSAYATAITHGESFLLSEKFGYQKDNGALERFKKDMPHLPKWFRLILIGILSQHEIKYFIKDKESENGDLKLITNQQISYGAAFNATHKAILRVYRTMKTLHDYFGEDAIRIHTDGIAINCTVESFDKMESIALDYLDQLGFPWTIKAIGQCWLHDIGVGFIGKKFMGNRYELRNKMRENNIKIKKEEPEYTPPPKILEKIRQDPAQLGLFNFEF